MKLFKRIISYTLLTLLVVVFASCEPRKQTLKNFCGGVVYEKNQFLNGGKVLIILKNDTITEVYVYTLDYRRYKLGDTIICAL
jgi:hypothetical protein